MPPPHAHDQPPVKLRLIWKACSSTQQDRPKQCFNDTMSEKSFSAWKLRVESKFQSGPVSLRYCPCPTGAGAEVSLPLESEQDFLQLHLEYKNALNAHSKPTTYRVLVFASAATPVDCTTLPSCSGLQAQRLSGSEHSTCTVDLLESAENVGARSIVTTRPRRLSQRTAAESAANQEQLCSACPVDLQRPTASTRPSPLSPSVLPLQKKQKLRLRGKPVDTESCVTPVQQRPGSATSAGSGALQPEVCWEHVLRSIVKTIDRHHFGSKLAAAARADL